VQHDRPGLEQHQIALVIDGDLAKRVELEVLWLVQAAERGKAHVVRLADLFQRPAHPEVARETLPLIRRLEEPRENGPI
jgi:hypothetical protein